MESIAGHIITSLVGLEAMTHLQTGIEESRYAAIDLRSAVIYQEHKEFPDGEYLAAELPSGKTVAVATHKLLQHVLLRHAEAQAAREGSNVHEEYAAIYAHFVRKTGFEF